MGFFQVSSCCVFFLFRQFIHNIVITYMVFVLTISGSISVVNKKSPRDMWQMEPVVVHTALHDLLVQYIGKTTIPYMVKVFQST